MLSKVHVLMHARPCHNASICSHAYYALVHISGSQNLKTATRQLWTLRPSL